MFSSWFACAIHEVSIVAVGSLLGCDAVSVSTWGGGCFGGALLLPSSGSISPRLDVVNSC